MRRRRYLLLSTLPFLSGCLLFESEAEPDKRLDDFVLHNRTEQMQVLSVTIDRDGQTVFEEDIELESGEGPTQLIDRIGEQTGPFELRLEANGERTVRSLPPKTDAQNYTLMVSVSPSGLVVLTSQ